MSEDTTPTEETFEEAEDGISQVSITGELGSAYLDYAMSVIVSRALPDLRDGLKPVHRRILYSMFETGNTHDKPYRKSARPVGDVMGKYHPHGDGSIYDALVRMTQDFSMSLPLLDGQGNFGSMDGDNAAAMRYTEIRLEQVALQLINDIGLNTVDFQDNYDGKDQEPVVLPAQFPNILVNGGSGIAVGMASYIPCYNMGEVIDATLELIENPDASNETLLELMPGPDFPTGGIILGKTGSALTHSTGKGRILVQAKTRIEDRGRDLKQIVIDEIPYQVNKAKLVEQVADVVRQKLVTGISGIQDESNRLGVRIVIELKRDSIPEVVLNQLWKFTEMQTSISSNVVVLNKGRPETMSLPSILRAFIEFREEIITRRTACKLQRARDRSHLLCGLAVAINNLDEVVSIIRNSAQPSDAREALMERDWAAEEIADYIRLIDDPLNQIKPDNTYKLSETQARAILELRLQRLTAMGIKENTDELQRLAEQIKDYLDILRSGKRIRAIISEELTALKEKFTTPRRTQIVDYEGEILDEDLIPQKDMVVIITHEGYIKRTPLEDYRQQLRGGKGLAGIDTKDEDIVKSLFVANTHDLLLCFATNGKAYKIKTWKLPLGGRKTKGKPLVNVLKVDPGVSISNTILIPEKAFKDPNNYIVFAYSNGNIRKSSLKHFEKIHTGGKIAFNVIAGEQLIETCLTNNQSDLIMATKNGQAIRFPVKLLREVKSRTSLGVRGIRCKCQDQFIGMVTVNSLGVTYEERVNYIKVKRGGELPEVEDKEADSLPLLIPVKEPNYFEQLVASEETILVITSDGSGKLTSSHEFPPKVNRGGYGVKANRVKGLVAFVKVELDDQIILVTDQGQVIRCGTDKISYRSRTAGGVRIMNLPEDSKIVSVAKIQASMVINDNKEDPESDENDDPEKEVE